MIAEHITPGYVLSHNLVTCHNAESKSRIFRKKNAHSGKRLRAKICPCEVTFPKQRNFLRAHAHMHTYSHTGFRLKSSSKKQMSATSSFVPPFVPRTTRGFPILKEICLPRSCKTVFVRMRIYCVTTSLCSEIREDMRGSCRSCTDLHVFLSGTGYLR